MQTALPKNDLDLHKAFAIILSIESFSDYIIDIAELIYNSELNRENIQKVLEEHGIRKIEDVKEELMDLVIVYINLILNDNVISENEKYNVELLKKYFKIKEGDFYTKRYEEVEDILNRQFIKIYSDNNINMEEAIHNVDLQGLFNLSYDQFDKFKENEIRRAIEQGADITDLDTAKFPESIPILRAIQGRHVSQQEKDLVWNRDNGKCRECGSNELLEFDYIIPFAKGGANSNRNIQLLCETCNKTRSNKTG
jgi:hypothetical protein